MVDSGLVEHHQRLEEVGAEALEEVEGQPRAPAENLRQGLCPGALEQECLSTPDNEWAFDELDDAWRLQRPEHVGLVAQAGRGLVVERHLEHPLVVSAIN